MKEKELKRKYDKASELHEESFKLLKEYVHGMLELHGGSIGFEVKDYDDFEEDGDEYYNQFPVVVDIDGKYDTFPLAVTKVWINEDEKIRVDGEEQGDWGSQWRESLDTREDYATYHSLAYFIDEVGNTGHKFYKVVV